MRSTKTLAAASRPRGRRRAIRLLTPVRGLVPLVVLLAAWQFFGNPATPYFPQPSRWITAIQERTESGELLPALGDTVAIFLISMLFVVAIGTALGILLGASGNADAALNPMFQFLRAIPASAIVPALSLMLGPTKGTMVVVVVVASIWPVLLGTRTAVQGLNPLLVDVGHTLGLGRAERLFKITLPSLYSAILIGASISAPTALLVTLLVQLLTGRAGLGALLGLAHSQFDASAVFGYVLICGLLAIAVNLVLRGLNRSVLRYLTTNSQNGLGQ